MLCGKAALYYEEGKGTNLTRSDFFSRLRYNFAGLVYSSSCSAEDTRLSALAILLPVSPSEYTKASPSPIATGSSPCCFKYSVLWNLLRCLQTGNLIAQMRLLRGMASQNSRFPGHLQLKLTFARRRTAWSQLCGQAPASWPASLLPHSSLLQSCPQTAHHVGGGMLPAARCRDLDSAGRREEQACTAAHEVLVLLLK